MNEELINSLHPLEIKILPSLKTCKTATDVIKQTNLKQVEVIRALQWLQDKNILKLTQETSHFIILTNTGKQVLEKALPEKRFLKLLPTTFDKLKNTLTIEEFNVSLGILKKAGAISIQKEIKALPNAKQILEDNKIENFLKALPKKEFELNKDLTKTLLKRNLIKKDLFKQYKIELTPLGIKLTGQKLKTDLLETLTPELLQTGKYKKKKFRTYNVKAPVQKLYPGKRHFVNQTIKQIKRIWLDMGFEEMTGDYKQSAFWTFDALFQPQDHPARDMQDTFFIKQKSKLPNKQLVNKVKQAHEKGISNSKGWQYKWKEEEAEKTVLRTHTTVLSAQTIAKLKQTDLPKKFFAIGRNFRNEALDHNHLFEFNQTEGIVVDPNVTFRDLLGYLKQFFKKMGFEKARFRPAYFPYTEPSVEIEVFHPTHKKWIELGGAGIFRPEVVTPLLGKPVPVLAWGLGLGRILSLNYKIKDIRDLYKNNLKQLRETKCQL